MDFAQNTQFSANYLFLLGFRAQSFQFKNNSYKS